MIRVSGAGGGVRPRISDRAASIKDGYMRAVAGALGGNQIKSGASDRGLNTQARGLFSAQIKDND